MALRWNASLARYRDTRSGRFVSPAEVRRELDRTLAEHARAVELLADDYRAGRVSLTQWRLSMRAAIRESHGYAAAAARGGFRQMTPTAWGQVGRIVRDEFGWLENLATEIRNGLPIDGHLTQRSRLYVQAARETYHRAAEPVERDRGAREWRNVLALAEHCTGTNSCLEVTDQGWQPMPVTSHPGTRICGRNCKCRIDYRVARSPLGEDDEPDDRDVVRNLSPGVDIVFARDR